MIRDQEQQFAALFGVVIVMGVLPVELFGRDQLDHPPQRQGRVQDRYRIGRVDGGRRFDTPVGGVHGA